MLTNIPPKTPARSILSWDWVVVKVESQGDTFFSLFLSEVKSSKKRGTSKNKHTPSDDEDERDDEEQSEDETDSEGEDMLEKEQSSSEEGTKWLYPGYKYEVIRHIQVSLTWTMGRILISALWEHIDDEK